MRKPQLAFVVTAIVALLATIGVASPASAGDPVESHGKAAFQHPGVLINRAMLDFVREKVDAGAQPWKDSYDEMAGSEYADTSWQPKPRPIVECGPSSHPDNGCTEETDDALAAYTQALLWYITRDQEHADKAIEIMNAWPPVIKDHTNSNAPLQTAWAGALWSRAAEIIRYSGAGWSGDDIGTFETMLRKVYLPEIVDGAPDYNGNWELIMMDATTGIAVFLNDHQTFDRALDMTRERVPAYIYDISDGDLPQPPPRSDIDSPNEIRDYWYGQSTFHSGLAQETCRDFGHVGWGLNAMSHIAETAWHQGVDLYGEIGKRLRNALWFHAQYALGKQLPSWLCGGSLEDVDLGPTSEVAFNHYHNREGIDMPLTQKWTEQQRPTGTDLFYAWESLTHANNPH